MPRLGALPEPAEEWVRGRWKEAAGDSTEGDAACELLLGPRWGCASATRALLPTQGPGAGQVCWMLDAGSASCHPLQAGASAPALLCHGLPFCPCLIQFILMLWGPSTPSWPALSDRWHWTPLPQAPAAGGWVQACHILSRTIVLWLMFPPAGPVGVELTPAQERWE